MDKKHSDLVSNRRARHDYEMIEVFDAGIVLFGPEIKSLRNNGGNLQDAYVKVIKDELWLVGCHIAPYRFGNIHNPDDKRDRKLLMHKREIEKLRIAVQEKGLTLIALGIYLNDGRAKVKLAIAKGKKTFDKRQDLKERDDKREMDRQRKNFS